MRILFDQNMPDQLAKHLLGFEIVLAREMGWSVLVNGRLLFEAEAAGFEVMVTGDKSIVKQQNNSLRRIALIVVGNTDRIVVEDHASGVLAALGRVAPGSYEAVSMPGSRDYMEMRRKQGR